MNVREEEAKRSLDVRSLSTCMIDSHQQVICREEEEAKIAAGKQIAAKLAKIKRRKAKAQQTKLAAVEPRSESNASDDTDALSTHDTFQLPEQRQLDSATKLSPRSQGGPTEPNIQDSPSGKASAKQSNVSPPARAASEALSVASMGSESISELAFDDGPWLSANAKARQASLKPALRAGHSTGHVSFDGQGSQRSHASSSSAAAAAAATGRSGLNTPIPASLPGGDVESLPLGPYQHALHGAVPDRDMMAMHAPKRKKQRSKKGKLPRDGSDALEQASSMLGTDELPTQLSLDALRPASSTPGITEMTSQLVEASSLGETPRTALDPEITAVTNVIGEDVPTGASAPQAAATSEQSEAGPASITDAVLAAASGQSAD